MGRRRLFLLVCLVAALCFMCSEYGWRHMNRANFFNPVSRGWELLAGGIAAFAMTRGTIPGRNGPAIAGLALVLLPVFLFDDATPVPSFYALGPVLGTVLLLLFARPDGWAGRVLCLPPMIWIGTVSYSAYLWHQPVFALARNRLTGEPAPLVMAGLIGVTLGLAWLTWRYVEQPFRGSAGARRLPRRRAFAVSAGGLAGVALVGLVGVGLHGGVNRLTPQAQAIEAEFAADFDRMMQGTRDGVCVFSDRAHKTVQAFLADWHCQPTSDGGRVASALGIYGDSHASSVIWALRSNGYDVLQLNGNACSLAPSRMTKDCRAVAEAFRAEALAEGISDIWLVNKFDEIELTPEVTAETIAYWQALGVRLTVFAPIPEFPDLQDRLVRQAWLGEGADLTPDAHLHDRFMQPDLRGLWDAAGIGIVDTGRLFCGDRPGCSPMAGGHPLLRDAAHLNAAGARMFGRTLLAEMPVPLHR